jgi:hypothetical protein
MATSHWLERLKQHWHLNSIMQVFIILIVFACTGFTVLFIKKPLLELLAGEEGKSLLASVLYYIFILPLYNAVLLAYGFIFGQFNFFWEFEKQMFKRIVSLFSRNR